MAEHSSADKQDDAGSLRVRSGEFLWGGIWLVMTAFAIYVALVPKRYTSRGPSLEQRFMPWLPLVILTLPMLAALIVGVCRRSSTGRRASVVGFLSAPVWLPAWLIGGFLIWMGLAEYGPHIIRIGSGIAGLSMIGMVRRGLALGDLESSAGGTDRAEQRRLLMTFFVLLLLALLANGIYWIAVEYFGDAIDRWDADTLPRRLWSGYRGGLLPALADTSCWLIASWTSLTLAQLAERQRCRGAEWIFPLGYVVTFALGVLLEPWVGFPSLAFEREYWMVGSVFLTMAVYGLVGGDSSSPRRSQSVRI